jgi:hypothetical protein
VAEGERVGVEDGERVGEDGPEGLAETARVGLGDPAGPVAVGEGEGVGLSTRTWVPAACCLFRMSAVGTTMIPISTVRTKTTAPHSRRTNAQFTTAG